MLCEACGKETNESYTTNIESTQMIVCRNCTRFGINTKKVAAPPKTKFKAKKSIQAAQSNEIMQLVDPNYASIIRRARDKRGLTQQQLANRLAQKESLIHSLESGKNPPNISLARKLEKFLQIILVQQHEEKPTSYAKSAATGPLTLGDMVIKKRRG